MSVFIWEPGGDADEVTVAFIRAWAEPLFRLWTHFYYVGLS